MGFKKERPIHPKTQTEWEEEMSEKIISLIRNEIYLDLRFLKIALAALRVKSDKKLRAFATDGVFLYYSPEMLIRVFQNNGRFLDRAYLHVILHCMFSHLWIAGKRDRRIWNLACDIVTEYTIDAMRVPCTRLILSWNRQQIYRKIRESGEGISAAVLYRQIARWREEAGRDEENETRGQEKTEAWLSTLEQEFYTDDHCYWQRENESRARQETLDRAGENWKKLVRQTGIERMMRGDETQDGAQFYETQIQAGRSRRSYRDFLRQFSLPREELSIDQDEFDLGYYSYGLRLYGNLPLVEPLESREVHRIVEFVIAVDTSFSTSGELVVQFLRETFDLLMEQNCFAAKAKIRIIQCDDRVRTDEEVSSKDQIEQLLRSFTVQGGGGTDFRPVFAYVDELITQGQLENLGGLLYFTDGKGTYPKKRPDYKTAFLFVGEYEEEHVPPWAMRVKLEPEDLEGEYQTGEGRNKTYGRGIFEQG